MGEIARIHSQRAGHAIPFPPGNQFERSIRASRGDMICRKEALVGKGTAQSDYAFDNYRSAKKCELAFKAIDIANGSDCPRIAATKQDSGINESIGNARKSGLN